MPQLAFHIDKQTSHAEGCLAINIQAPDPNVKLSEDKLYRFSGPKEKDAIAFLIQEELSHLSRQKGKAAAKHTAIFNTVHISYGKAQQALKLLAATGKLFFAERRLICDFFSPAEFYYRVEILPSGLAAITGIIKANDKEFNVRECDFVCGGPPHVFIKGITLKFLKTEISWKDFRQVYDEPSSVTLGEIQGSYGDEQLPETLSPKIVFVGNAEIVSQQQRMPLPQLVLKDRMGSFADLWMVYDIGEPYGKVRVPYHDPSPYIKGPQGRTMEKRQRGEEAQWEQDLLQTGFIKKMAGTSHYYCPLDKTGKSLAFLLEVGWEIRDWQNREVLHQSKLDVQLLSQPQGILVKGKLKYSQYEADLDDVVGAFNRRENFVLLGSGAVGLLPSDLGSSGLASAIEEGEIVSGGIRIPRNRFGCLGELFETRGDITCDESLLHLKEKMQNFERIEESAPGPEFQGQLRPYQQTGLNWLSFLYDYGFHGLLADDMGLGKTIEVLSFLSRLKNPQPILIIMPTSLIFNWKREIERFIPARRILVHHGPMRKIAAEVLAKADIILTSYTTLRLDLPVFLPNSFECVILDEAQNIKNSRTQIAQAVYRLKSRFRLSLTGTPIENHLSEIWSHFHFLIPDLLGDEKEFDAEIQAAAYDSRYLKRVRKKIRPFLLRRKKEEVANDLPERIEQVVWVEMGAEQRQFYDDFLAGIKGGLFKKIEADGMSKHRMEILEAILRLRQICCHPLLAMAQSEAGAIPESAKLEALMQDLETAIDEGRKVLIYSQFTSMLALIAKEVKKRQWNYVYLDGSTTDRERVVLQFQEDPTTPLFLISLKAGGFGLNLTAADYVFLYDPWWNEAVENQAIDRAHRIGRTDTVIAKRYVAVESIEEKIMKLKEAKRSLAADVLADEMSHVNLTLEDFRFLFS